MPGNGRNLMAAESGMEMANAALRGRACNRPEDIAHGAMQVLKNSHLALPTNPTKAEATSSQLLFQQAANIAQSKHDGWVQQARNSHNAFDALAILRDKYGNCHEHAVVVGYYIGQRFPGVTAYHIGIDMPWDHCFVIVGAPTGLPEGRDAMDITLDTPPAAFGTDAYVADAWYHEVFAVQSGLWSQKLGRILLTTCHDKSLSLPDSLKADVKRLA